MCGAKMGLCLPRSRVATWLASRPNTTSAASITCHCRSMSPGFGLYVRTGLTLTRWSVGWSRAPRPAIGAVAQQRSSLTDRLRRGPDGVGRDNRAVDHPGEAPVTYAETSFRKFRNTDDGASPHAPGPEYAMLQ